MQINPTTECSPVRMKELALEIYAPMCDCFLDIGVWVVATISANGSKQFRFQCKLCERRGSPILRTKLDSITMETAPVVANNITGEKCQRCGLWVFGVERHHWAPADVFKDFHQWPTAWLCPKCHHRWHETMNGYRWKIK